MRHVGREVLKPWANAADQSKLYAFYKTTGDMFKTHDHIAVIRLTITYERKDDGKRVTKIVWLSNDSRAISRETKLGKLLADMRPKIARERQAIARLLDDGIL